MNLNLLSLILVFFVSYSQAAIKIAITVDDLPTHGALPPGITREMIAIKMTEIFQKHKVPEVYAFINSGKVETKKESLEVLQIWKNAGFPFGNHTYLHEDINLTSAADYRKAIDLNEPLLQNLSGTNDWKYFRYPYLREGETLEMRNNIRSYLKEKNYKIAQVTIDFEDWAWNDPYARCKIKNDTKSIQWLKDTYLKNATDMVTRAETISHALFKRSIPHILLLHIGAFDTEMLDTLLTEYKKMGVVFIPLSEASQDKVYAIDPGLPAKWGSELTYQIMKSKKLGLADVGLKKYEDYPDEKLTQFCRH
jgi:peptidoglycan/xylan/chitin deacetylase (PgdA/CDA1 family)